MPRSQERIEDLNAQLKATREYAEYQARVISELTKGAAPTNGAAPAAAMAPADDPAPTLEGNDFDSAKLAKAQAEWLDRQVSKRVQAAMQQQTAEQQAAAMRATFDNREAAFRAATPDYDIVTRNPTLPPLGKNAARLVVQSEKGPEIVYHLAKNPNVAAHIARMPPENQAMAIGRLEAQLSAPASVASTPAQRRTTQAPPPPSAAPQGGASGGTRDPSKMTMKEFVEAERQAAAERRARRGKH